MIEFLDGAMAAYLSQMFNAFVIWSPADLSRQNLARKAQDKNRNDLGLPGIAVFRTSCSRRPQEDFNQTLGSLGWPSGKTAEGDFAITKAVLVQAEYSVQVWSQHMSDINMIDRELNFLTIGNPVHTVIRCKNYEGEDVEIPLPFACDIDDPIYSYQAEDKTGKLNFFGLQTKLYVDCQWVKSDLIKRIEQIDILYQTAVPGSDPITYEQLDFIKITQDEVTH